MAVLEASRHKCLQLSAWGAEVSEREWYRWAVHLFLRLWCQFFTCSAQSWAYYSICVWIRAGYFFQPYQLLTLVESMIIVIVNFFFLRNAVTPISPQILFMCLVIPGISQNFVLALPEWLLQSSSCAGACDCHQPCAHHSVLSLWFFPGTGVNITNPQHMSSLRLTSDKY